METNRNDVAVGLPKTEGNIVGSIDGRVAVAHSYGNDDKPIPYLEWSAVALPLRHAVSAVSFKMTAATAQLVVLPFRLLLPEGKQGVSAVDDFIPAVWVGVEGLGVATNPGNAGAAVSDFARNFEGNIVGNIVEKVAR